MASDAKKVSVEDARQEVARGDAVAVDVRSEEEWSKGHVPGAIHFPEGGRPPSGPTGSRRARG